MPTPKGYVTAFDVVGPRLSYRKLDYWTRIGLVAAMNPDVGSGRRRYWSVAEARVVNLMARYVAAGVTLQAAHRAARNDGWLAPGVRIVLSSDQDDHPGEDSSTVARH